MKKTINRKVYNTDTAEKLGQFAQGFFGDPAGYEEVLYVTKKGRFFLYGIGGKNSRYPNEDITVITEKEADLWLNEHKN